MKNSIVIIGVVVIAAAGIYLLTQRDIAMNVLTSESGVSEEVVANTQLFIERSAALNSVQLDSAVLDDARLTSLRSYATPIPQRPVGRSNPFEPAARVGF